MWLDKILKKDSDNSNADLVDTNVVNSDPELVEQPANETRKRRKDKEKKTKTWFF